MIISIKVEKAFSNITPIYNLKNPLNKPKNTVFANTQHPFMIKKRKHLSAS